MKKTTKKDGPRRVDFLIYSFCMVLSLMLFFCTREDNIGFLGHNKNKINLSGKGVLPVRLSMFDHNFQTKSFEQISDSSSFSLDSLITFDGFRQVFYDKSGWTYEEFPFKSNTGGLYGALYAKHKLGSLTNNVQSANKLKIICAEIGLDFLFGEGYVSGNDSVSVNLVNPDFINRTMYECE